MVHTVRGLLSGILVLAAVLLIPAVISALWVQFVLLEGDAFAEMTDDILDEDDVRFAVRETLADEIQATFPEARIPGVRPILTRSIESAYDIPAFRQVFAQSVASAHQQLADGEDEVTVRLGDVYPVIATEVAGSVPVVADVLASYESSVEITLVRQEEQPALWTAFQWTRAGSVLILAGFMAAAGLALILSPARGQTLAFLGLAGAGVCILVIFAAPYASRPLTVPDPAISDGVDAAWGVVSTSVRPIALVLAAVLGSAGVTGLLWPGGRRQRW